MYSNSSLKSIYITGIVFLIFAIALARYSFYLQKQLNKSRSEYDALQKKLTTLQIDYDTLKELKKNEQPANPNIIQSNESNKLIYQNELYHYRLKYPFRFNNDTVAVTKGFVGGRFLDETFLSLKSEVPTTIENSMTKFVTVYVDYNYALDQIGENASIEDWWKIVNASDDAIEESLQKFRAGQWVELKNNIKGLKVYWEYGPVIYIAKDRYIYIISLDVIPSSDSAKKQAKIELEKYSSFYQEVLNSFEIYK